MKTIILIGLLIMVFVSACTNSNREPMSISGQGKIFCEEKGLSFEWKEYFSSSLDFYCVNNTKEKSNMLEHYLGDK